MAICQKVPETWLSEELVICQKNVCLLGIGPMPKPVSEVVMDLNRFDISQVEVFVELFLTAVLV